MSEENPPNMGTWNNRIFRHKSEHGEWYEIHETHYADDGKPIGWTVDPAEPYGETVDELIESNEDDADGCRAVQGCHN